MIARTEWGQWEAMAGKCLKLPAVLSWVKWSSAWWRTSTGSWLHIAMCHLNQLSSAQKKKKKSWEESVWNYIFGRWTGAEIDTLLSELWNTLVDRAVNEEFVKTFQKPHCNSTAKTKHESLLKQWWDLKKVFLAKGNLLPHICSQQHCTRVIQFPVCALALIFQLTHSSFLLNCSIWHSVFKGKPDALILNASQTLLPTVSFFIPS